MEQTPNYHLNKPGYDEFGDVEVLNQNFAAIDTELKNNVDAVNARVKTAELAAEVKKVVKDGSLPQTSVRKKPERQQRLKRK